jgi:F-type H+-transporting ATPase subunit b
MDSTLQALGGILLKAVPTIILLLIVHFYLKGMFFGPLQKVLAERRAATEGAREAADAMVKNAAAKAAALEAELRKAHDEIYREQEEARRRLLADQTASLEDAKRQSRELIHQGKLELEAETAAAKRELAATTDALAEQIVSSLLQRKAS